MRREKTTKPREHWLDYSELIHGKKLVLETKILLNVLVLFTPLPIFWSLFDQQGSRWTFQATKMQLDLGFYKIKPDQMQVINPLLILMFIPLVDYVVYPFLHKIFVRRPLQKMTLGGILAGVAFLMSAFVQMQIDNSDPKTICVLWQIPQYVTMTLGEVRLKTFCTANTKSFIYSGDVFCYWSRVFLHSGTKKHEVCDCSLLASELTFD